MGNIKVLVRDPESVNFDRICRLTLEMQVVRQAPIDAIEVVSAGPLGPNDFDIDGDEADRMYWKRGHRSMTEAYADRMGLGKSDASGAIVESVLLPPLVSLCQALAKTHDRTGGEGGYLYKTVLIPNFAKALPLMPDCASEIVGQLVRVVAESLGQDDPVTYLTKVDCGSYWQKLSADLSAREHKVFDHARDAVHAYVDGTYPDGEVFLLAKASGESAPRGITLRTRNPNMMKHLWAALKKKEAVLRVAVAVVSHPETGRIAVQTSEQYPVVIADVHKALKKAFPGAEFDANYKRCSIIWDPRSQKAAGPTAERMKEIVSKHLAFRETDKQAQGLRFGATLGDRFIQKRR
ncbi:MAG: hypothetical protein AAB554_05025 [Patescibacteria group bacterium]